MSSRQNEIAAAIAAVLNKSAARVTPRHATAWDVVFRNGTELPARVALDGDWLHLDAPFGFTEAAAEGALWSLLTRNASLPPGLKLAVAVGDAAAAPPVRLCGEILMDDAAEPAVRVLELCTRIKAVAHVWPAPDAPRMDEDPPETTLDLAAMCHDTRWPARASDGSVLVDLDVPDGFAQARVVTGPRGTVSATVAVGDEPPCAAVRPALALLLLRTSASVRLVRAAADATPRFEVALAPPVSAAALAHGLAALSVACRMAAREAAVVARDAAVAEAYWRHAAPGAAERMAARPP